MPFMVPYWATVVLLGILTFLGVGVSIDLMDGGVSGRGWRIWRRILIAAVALVLILIFLGVWLPFFIPGLY